MPWVIKYGGSAMTDPTLRLRIATEIRELADRGERPVVVHGGGPFIGRALDRAGVEHSFVRGLRVTPPKGMEVVEAVLTQLGKILAQEIGNALGLTGRDAGLLVAERFDEELGEVGRMRSVNKDAITTILDSGFTPVLACLAIAPDGSLLNVNGDEVTGAVAGALRSPVIFLTDVPGVLEEPADPSSLIAHITLEEIESRIADGRISGGMIPKVEGATSALKRGAPSAMIVDGRYAGVLGNVQRGAAGTKVTLS